MHFLLDITKYRTVELMTAGLSWKHGRSSYFQEKLEENGLLNVLAVFMSSEGDKL